MGYLMTLFRKTFLFFSFFSIFLLTSVNANEYNAVWDQENNRWGGINGDVSVYWDPDTSSWKNA